MNKINDIAKKWLTNNYGNLESYETDKYPNYTFFMKDGKVILDYNRKNGYCDISYEEIWSFLKLVFRLEYEEIQDITKEWVEEHCKLKVTSTYSSLLKKWLRVEEHCKLKVTSTTNKAISAKTLMGEHYKLKVTSTHIKNKYHRIEVEEHYEEKKDI